MGNYTNKSTQTITLSIRKSIREFITLFALIFLIFPILMAFMLHTSLINILCFICDSLALTDILGFIRYLLFKNLYNLVLIVMLVLTFLFFTQSLQFAKKLCSRSRLIINFINIVNKEIKFISMAVSMLVNNIFIKPILNLYGQCIEFITFIIDIFIGFIILLFKLLIICGTIYFLFHYPLQFIGVMLLYGIIK